MSLIIRDGAAEDAPLVLKLVTALAGYEKLAEAVTASASDFASAIGDGAAHVLIAEWDSAPCGFALYFHNFSTFLGRRGVYLEDLFVEETHRGRGIGKALLARLARIASEQNCGRLEWQVLDWNAPAIAFYKSLGAAAMDEWTVYRVAGDALDVLAREDC